VSIHQYMYMSLSLYVYNIYIYIDVYIYTQVPLDLQRLRRLGRLRAFVTCRKQCTCPQIPQNSLRTQPEEHLGARNYQKHSAGPLLYVPKHLF
jgi:hypothetical protein